MMDKSLQKSLGNLDRMLSKNADINMAVVLFLVVYLAFDIKEFVPEFLNNEIVRLVVIALAVYLLLRCNMGKINGGSHACTVGILLLLAAVLHRPNAGFLGSMRRRTMEGFASGDITVPEGNATATVGVAFNVVADVKVEDDAGTLQAAEYVTSSPTGIQVNVEVVNPPEVADPLVIGVDNDGLATVTFTAAGAYTLKYTASGASGVVTATRTVEVSADQSERADPPAQQSGGDFTKYQVHVREKDEEQAQQAGSQQGAGADSLGNFAPAF